MELDERDPWGLGDPSHSVLWEGRLGAYLWDAPEGGTLSRAGRDAVVCDVTFANIRTFSPKVEEMITALLPRCSRLSALVFKLGMEGCEVQPGRVQPDPTVRRF